MSWMHSTSQRTSAAPAEVCHYLPIFLQLDRSSAARLTVLLLVIIVHSVIFHSDPSEGQAPDDSTAFSLRFQLEGEDQKRDISCNAQGGQHRNHIAAGAKLLPVQAVFSDLRKELLVSLLSPE